MCQLEGTKCSFLLCLGISIIICSVIYLRTRVPTEPKPLETPSCRAYSAECKAILPGVDRGAEWYRHNGQVERLSLNSGLQCSDPIRDLHFITKPLSREEEDYPLAFIVTVHKELGLLVRLLRAIYMPQNVYCIHVDAKAPLEYQEAVRRLVSCFKNTFLSSRSETVTYAGFSRLQADLNCMTDLAKSKIGWKKVVNLCGQDFPIMSNLELVRYMQSKEWRDINMTPGVKQPVSMKHRTQLQHREITGSHVVRKDAPGSHIDGGWAGDIRAIKWRDQEGRGHNGCKGRYVRDICIFGVEDLPWIINKNSMFANKFESKTFPEALDCLEQWHRNKVLNQATVPIEPSWLLATQSNSSGECYNSSAGA
ncbi:beta-1,3-galactosyl-O-glycosyl-glycoprotein beta-1,6-N-acetylglucosaminyltransferase 7 isoform 2-T2 [Tautogolabrus adspersus]